MNRLMRLLALHPCGNGTIPLPTSCECTLQQAGGIEPATASIDEPAQRRTNEPHASRQPRACNTPGVWKSSPVLRLLGAFEERAHVQHCMRAVVTRQRTEIYCTHTPVIPAVKVSLDRPTRTASQSAPRRSPRAKAKQANKRMNEC